MSLDHRSYILHTLLSSQSNPLRNMCKALNIDPLKAGACIASAAVCVCIHVYIYIYIYVTVYIYTFTYAYIYIYIYICACV